MVPTLVENSKFFCVLVEIGTGPLEGKLNSTCTIATTADTTSLDHALKKLFSSLSEMIANKLDYL